MFETPHSRWRALEMRNPLAASAFLYGVKTTHIYCRPTCPSRLARKANVVFFDLATEAERAGFRACKRCKPSQIDFEHQAGHKKAVRKACELMDAAGGILTLESLAHSVGLSPRYFHGVFKAVLGLTPRVYAMRLRKERSCRKGLPSQERDGVCVQDEGSPPSRKEDEGTALPSWDLSFIDLPLGEDTEFDPASLGTPSYRDAGSCCQHTTPLTGPAIFNYVPLRLGDDCWKNTSWKSPGLDHGDTPVATDVLEDILPTANITGPQDEDDFLGVLLADQPRHFDCYSNILYPDCN